MPLDEQSRRAAAIRRVALGESISKVCADLGRSRVWYYKWANRFEHGGSTGLEDRRRHNRSGNHTPERMQALILQSRDRLVRQARQGTSFRGIGAREVAADLRQLEVEPPHWTTIHRILKRAGRITPPTHGHCPRPAADALNAVHQVDIWPRVIEGGEPLYFFHLVDVASWYPHGLISAEKSTDTALAFLAESWQILGRPRIAQLDNEMTFTGGRWAHLLGRVVRLCLALGVEVWFIPFDTPERNGYVEHFHGECDQFFWSRRRFKNVAQAQQAYPAFLDYFRHQRRLPAIGYRTPAQMRATWRRTAGGRLASNFGLHRRERLPLVAGTIHCVRLADRHGQVNILNRIVELGTDYAKHYVVARIAVAKKQMTLYHQPEADAAWQKITTHPFPLRETIRNFNGIRVNTYTVKATVAGGYYSCSSATCRTPTRSTG